MDETEVDHAHPMAMHHAEASLREAFDGDVTVLDAVEHLDPRGRLIAFDPETLPFTARRIFTVTEVPAGTVRGRHAHRRGTQALFCIAGRVDVGLRRGPTTHAPVTLVPGGPGLCISGGIWSEQRYVLEGSALLAIASDPYDPDSYESDA